MHHIAASSKSRTKEEEKKRKKKKGGKVAKAFYSRDVQFFSCIVLVAIVMLLCSYNAVHIFSEIDGSGSSSYKKKLLTYFSNPNSSPNSNSNNSNNNNNSKAIDYKLIRGLNYNNTYDIFYTCDQSTRAATHPIFTQPNMFNFHVQISTPLHILYMGDSVGMQFSQALQEATGTSHANRHVLRYSWRSHEGLHLASHVRGGGSVAGWRITGMLRAKQRDNHYQMPQCAGGGWMDVDLQKIRRSLAILTSNTHDQVQHLITNNDTCAHQSLQTLRKVTNVKKNGEYIWKTNNVTSPIDPGQHCPTKNFDVVIHQIPFGWFVKPANVSIYYEVLDETVRLSNELFGATTIILQTIPVGNNLKDFRYELETMNDIIYNYTNTFQYQNKDNQGDNQGEKEDDVTTKSRPIKAVLLMDMEKLSLDLFKYNAQALGLIELNEQGNDDRKSLHTKLNPLIDYRTKCCHRLFPQIIGFTCAEVVSNFTEECIRTRYSNDGHHFCLDELGGRIHGVTACLIQCANTDFDGSKSYHYQLKECEQRCNDQYMTLNPIPFGDEGVLENY